MQFDLKSHTVSDAAAGRHRILKALPPASQTMGAPPKA